MKANDQFLADLMQHLDLRYFTPSLYKYFTDFLEIEKVRRFKDQYVLNTFIPPYPGAAFDRFLNTFLGDVQTTFFQSVDLAVTNACIFKCWHCYNAGRQIQDLPEDILKYVVRKIQESGAIVINFTGGEPCLRADLPEICSELDENCCGIVATTGYGFTDRMAARLRETPVYSISISLDSFDEEEHDKKRGSQGAFEIALHGIETALKWGFYTYTCAVPSKKLLEPENFDRFVEFNKSLGVYELQLIEPTPAGKSLGRKISLDESDYGKIFQYMAKYNKKEDNISITSFAHMELPEFFGCGAGFSHIYIDGRGEVSPCNMIPVSYGNAARDDLEIIMRKMQADLKNPCRVCLAQTLNNFLIQHIKNKKPLRRENLPSIPYPEDTDLPGFFQIIEKMENEIAGNGEVISGYNDASTTYEDYWLSVAHEPINEMFARLEIKPGEKAVDCGCGTGYSSSKIAQDVGESGKVIGIDLSPGMIEIAQKRMKELCLNNVQFINSDVLNSLERLPPHSCDLAVLTWLIGYVGCSEIFPPLHRLLKTGGKIGFVAHLDRSPLVPIEVFEEITRENPAALEKAVKLKFPKNEVEIIDHLKNASFNIEWIKQGTFDVLCQSGQEAYDHVIKSGAGTTFYYSIKPDFREKLTHDFIERVNKRFLGQDEFNILHEYVVGVGRTIG